MGLLPPAPKAGASAISPPRHGFIVYEADALRVRLYGVFFIECAGVLSLLNLLSRLDVVQNAFPLLFRKFSFSFPCIISIADFSVHGFLESD